MNALIANTLRALSDPGLSRDRLSPGFGRALDHLQALALLAARCYVSYAFFLSGLTKLRDWSATLALFEDYYQVPLLPPALAAYLGAGGELVLPVLLLFGFAGRFAAAGLFVVNLMAVVSLPAEDLSAAGLAHHTLWGTLAALVVLWGAGRWSVDAWRSRNAGATRGA